MAHWSHAVASCLLPAVQQATFASALWATPRMRASGRAASRPGLTGCEGYWPAGWDVRERTGTHPTPPLSLPVRTRSPPIPTEPSAACVASRQCPTFDSPSMRLPELPRPSPWTRLEQPVWGVRAGAGASPCRRAHCPRASGGQAGAYPRELKVRSHLGWSDNPQAPPLETATTRGNALQRKRRSRWRPDASGRGRGRGPEGVSRVRCARWERRRLTGRGVCRLSSRRRYRRRHRWRSPTEKHDC